LAAHRFDVRLGEVKGSRGSGFCFGGAWNRQRRGADTAGHPEVAGGVEDRDLAELREIQYVVPENLLLLPVFQLGAAQVLRNRHQHAMAVVEVQLDLCRNLLCQRLISKTDGPLGAVGQLRHRYQAVEE